MMKKYWLVPVSLLAALLLCYVEAMSLLTFGILKERYKRQPDVVSPFYSEFYGTRWIAQEADLKVDVARGYEYSDHKAVLIVDGEEHILKFDYLVSITNVKVYFVDEVLSRGEAGLRSEEVFTGVVEWLKEGESFIFDMSHCDLLGDLEQLTFVRARIPFAELPQNAPKKYQLSV